jgi:hypothetical protein
MTQWPLLATVASRRLELLVLLLGVMSAFFIGRWSAQPSGGPDAAGRDAAASALRPAGRTDARFVEQPVKIPAAFADAELKSDAERLALHAITEPPGLRRLTSLQGAMESITAANWEPLFEVLWKARRENLLNETEFDLVMQRIGEVAGRGGLTRFRPNDPVNESETHSARFAMRGWADADPAAAWAFIQEQPEGKFREGMITGYVWAAGATDPTAAMKALEILPTGAQAQLLRGTLNRRDGPHYAALAEQWLEANSSGEAEGSEQAQRQVFSALLGVQSQQRWSDPSGERIARWIERFAGRAYVGDEHVMIAAMHQAEENPEKALEWTGQFTAANPKLGGRAAHELMERYAKRDVAAAAQWLDANRESPLYTGAVGGFLRSQREHLDPETTNTWLATIVDEKARMRVAENLARRGSGRGRGNRGR